MTIKDALEVLEEYRRAAEKFVRKVESGRARSVETYTDLKNALASHKEREDSA